MASPFGSADSICKVVSGELPILVTVNIKVTASPSCPSVGLTESTIEMPTRHGLACAVGG
jgi:hypothetical protein